MPGHRAHAQFQFRTCFGAEVDTCLAIVRRRCLPLAWTLEWWISLDEYGMHLIHLKAFDGKKLKAITLTTRTKRRIWKNALQQNQEMVCGLERRGSSCLRLLRCFWRLWSASLDGASQVVRLCSLPVRCLPEWRCHSWLAVNWWMNTVQSSTLSSRCTCGAKGRRALKLRTRSSTTSE